MSPVAQTLCVIAALLLLGALGEFIFSRTRVPDVIWLVGAGIIAGPVLHIISPDLLQPAMPFFGAIALTVILSGGAFRLRLEEVAAAAPRGISLGLVGFAASVAGIFGFIWVATMLGLVQTNSMLAWLIAGAIVGGTSSVVIMPSMAMCRVPARIARTLEVESAATDALSVVIVMVLIDLAVSGSADVARPFVALGRELGLGITMGVVAAALMIPGIRVLRDRPHGYTVLLASMLALYAITESVSGNAAMAVLTASLLLGNASVIVPKLFPGASGAPFTASETTAIVQDQMTFLIKSFFFFMIGLLFPVNVRAIATAAAGVAVLFLSRIPAVLLTTRGMRLSRKEFWFTAAAIPRGLAAGVLATIPLRYGIAGENLAPTMFALIVFSILGFAIAFSIIGRLPDPAEPQPEGSTSQSDSGAAST